jgi:hypothetical protein
MGMAEKFVKFHRRNPEAPMVAGLTGIGAVRADDMVLQEAFRRIATQGI